MTDIGQCIYLGVEPKIRGFYPPNHPFVHRVFHYFHHPFWGPTPIFGNTHLHEWLIFMVNVGKYTSPMDPMGCVAFNIYWLMLLNLKHTNSCNLM